MREKDICPKVCKCADLKCQAQHSAERHEAGINKYFDEHFHLMKFFG